MILQSAGDNLGCRCRTCVHQNDHWRAFGYITRYIGFSKPALDIVFVAATFGYYFATVQKCVRYRNSLIKQSARIGAQIYNKTKRLTAQFLGNALNGLNNVFAGILREAGNRNQTDLVLYFPFYRLQIDFCTRNANIKRFITAWPEYSQLDRCTRSAAHCFYRLIQRAAYNQLPVKMCNVIARLYARLIGGCICCGCNNLYCTLIKCNR